MRLKCLIEQAFCLLSVLPPCSIRASFAFYLRTCTIRDVYGCGGQVPFRSFVVAFCRRQFQETIVDRAGWLKVSFNSCVQKFCNS
jgi:hypothetical protein